jgi:hypothetical protein
MTMIMSLNTEEARMLPEAVFSRPLDVISEGGLTRGQKIATLERWRQTLLDRIAATGEGMTPPAGQSAQEAARVEEIGEALRILLETETGRPE